MFRGQAEASSERPDQLRLSPVTSQDTTTVKFVDAEALRALEGEPPEHSIGSVTLFKGETGEAGQTKKAENVEATNKAPTSKQDRHGPHGFDSSSEEEPVATGLGPRNQFDGRIDATCRTFQNTMNSNPKSVPRGNHRKPQAQQSTALNETDDGYFTPSPMSSPASSSFASYTYGSPRLVEIAQKQKKPVALERDDTGASSMSRNPFRQPTQPAPVQPGAHDPVADEWWKGVDEKKAANLSPQDLGSLDSHAWAGRDLASNHTVASSSWPQANTLVQENVAQELPPPYSEKQQEKAEKPGRQRGHDSPPSRPLPVSPGLLAAATGPGDISLVDLPLTPPVAAVQEVRDVPLPDRPIGTFVPASHAIPMTGRGARQKEERRRRRHEKEDVRAYKVGGFWMGRGWLPEHSYLGRPGREGRKRRRVALGMCCGLLALIILGIVLGLVLGRRSTSAKVDAPSPAGQPVNGSPATPAPTAPTASPTSPTPLWLTVSGFPPVPTGVLTIIGPDNKVARSTCINPPTLWSCALPPEQAPNVLPYEANQPTFVLQIQYDNNTRALWDVPPGVTPSPVVTTAPSTPPVFGEGSLATLSVPPVGNIGRRREPAAGLSPLWRGHGTRQLKYDAGIKPDPAPPTFGEMWFLGNTTDDIVSPDKAGEPTPFYITFLASANASQGSNVLSRRAESKSLMARQAVDGNLSDPNTAATNLSALLPAPELNADGTGAPARLLPLPVQQPLRLFDRGLSTEHYGFYNYFNKTIYVQDATSANGNSAADAAGGGGSPEDQALYLATFGFARYRVQIWTNRTKSTHLLGTGKGRGKGKRDKDGDSVRPGTFPYPVTLAVDMHGGPPPKYSYRYGVGAGQIINRQNANLLWVNMTAGGTVWNPTSYLDADLGNPSFGGYNGGSGGCQCLYQNFA